VCAQRYGYSAGASERVVRSVHDRHEGSRRHGAGGRILQMMMMMMTMMMMMMMMMMMTIVAISNI
jgi:hypothetical protein